jgi:hypothetical protein
MGWACSSDTHTSLSCEASLRFSIINKMYVSVQSNTNFIIKVKVKVSIEQATKAQRRIRGIILLFL